MRWAQVHPESGTREQLRPGRHAPALADVLLQAATLLFTGKFWVLGWPDVSLIWIRTKCPGHHLWPLIPRNVGNICGPAVPAHPPRHTQEVTKRRVQHPEEQQELPELPLHGLLTLLEVPVLWGKGHVRGCTQSFEGAASHPCPEPHHKLHEATETPEGIHLILNDIQDRREEVTHALDVACGDMRSGPGLGPQYPRGRPCPSCSAHRGRSGTCSR